MKPGWRLKTVNGLYFLDGPEGVDYIANPFFATSFDTQLQAAKVGEVCCIEFRYTYPVWVEMTVWVD
jgi:hypothetical protein